jgi:hypothetical protein
MEEADFRIRIRILGPQGELIKINFHRPLRAEALESRLVTSHPSRIEAAESFEKINTFQVRPIVDLRVVARSRDLKLGDKASTSVQLVDPEILLSGATIVAMKRHISLPALPRL